MSWKGRVRNFNPRSHEGSDRSLPASGAGGHYFNPRSHEGSDYKHPVFIGDTKISIHAPTRGATEVVTRSDLRKGHFNPRSHEGSDGGKGVRKCDDTHFNPRSHEGSDKDYRRNLQSSFGFQSTLPRGERPSRSCSSLRIRAFQSTLPRGERLFMSLLTLLLRHFNPRSHEGSDYQQAMKQAVAEIFQSTLPRGERLVSVAVCVASGLFQSTLPRGERRCSCRL